MLAGLRHHAVIAGHDQQGMIDTPHPRQHVRQKLLVPWYINKTQHAAVWLGPVGIAQVDSHAALFLFRQTIGVYASNRLQQRSFSVVDMTGGGNNHFINISRNRSSSSRQRRSSHIRPS